MITCKQATQLISHRLDRDLSLGRRLSLRFHLLICHYCRRYARHLRFLHRAAPGLEEHIEAHGQPLPDAAREKLKQSLKNDL
jgi:hypothetical protein